MRWSARRLHLHVDLRTDQQISRTGPIGSRTSPRNKSRRHEYAVKRREDLVAEAVKAGYRTDAVYRPPIRDYIIRKLADGKYQEKQVDTSVVAFLVRSAIARAEDHHVVITGDSCDILPAVRVAYPEFTRNVFVATTHPDELNPSHRQTAFSLVDFEFQVPPFFMQNRRRARAFEGTARIPVRRVRFGVCNIEASAQGQPSQMQQAPRSA